MRAWSFQLVAGWLALVVLAGGSSGVWAIEVTNGSTSVSKDTVYLDATAVIKLPETVESALDKGVDLHFVTIVKIVKPRQLLPDKAPVNLEIVRRLGFHALTKKYVVDDLTLGRRKSFTSLPRALSYLGRYRDIPLVNETVVDPSQDTRVRMRIKLMHQKLPLPLRLKRTFSRAWRLSSDWYTWPLK